MVFSSNQRTDTIQQRCQNSVNHYGAKEKKSLKKGLNREEENKGNDNVNNDDDDNDINKMITILQL